MAWRDLDRPSPAPLAPTPPRGVRAALCVLASGSSGNCSLLRVWDADGAPLRTSLIDAGLSPRKTQRLLGERGVSLRDLDDVILTHLDTDHFHAGWRRERDCHATLRLHARHVTRAQKRHSLLRRNEPFEGPIEMGSPDAPVRLDPVLLSHDDLGVAAFRFEFPCGGMLGFATDLGRVTQELIDHVQGVDVLAIESNYCPVMQADSPRPEFLKKRITGGSGHLSNQECARATRRIAPASDVVLLHLSRQCNTPKLATEGHADAPYTLTVSSQTEPTDWVWIAPKGERPPRIGSTLFDGIGAG